MAIAKYKRQEKKWVELMSSAKRRWRRQVERKTLIKKNTQCKKKDLLLYCKWTTLVDWLRVEKWRNESTISSRYKKKVAEEEAFQLKGCGGMEKTRSRLARHLQNCIFAFHLTTTTLLSIPSTTATMIIMIIFLMIILFI